MNAPVILTPVDTPEVISGLTQLGAQLLPEGFTFAVVVIAPDGRYEVSHNCGLAALRAAVEDAAKRGRRV